MSAKIIAIDFDGTLCRNAWPRIGAPHHDVIARAIQAKRAGAKLVLWTCREGASLQEALAWAESHGLVFDGVNENLPALIAKFGNDCRKIGADEYWDDRSVAVVGGRLCYCGRVPT